jgi:hypothetical protein
MKDRRIKIIAKYMKQNYKIYLKFLKIIFEILWIIKTVMKIHLKVVLEIFAKNSWINWSEDQSG